MLQKKRVSLTLSFIPSQPNLSTTAVKKFSPVKKERSKELIRERLFRLEQFRREQLEKMKSRKKKQIKKPISNLSEKSQSSESDIQFESKCDKKPVRISQSKPISTAPLKMRTPDISFSKLKIDPELEVNSALIHKKINNLVNISKLLATKVEKLSSTKTLQSPVEAKTDHHDLSEISESINGTTFIDKLDSSNDSINLKFIPVKNINYRKNIPEKESVLKVLKLKVANKVKAAVELPHSTSVSELSVSDNEEILLPPLPTHPKYHYNGLQKVVKSCDATPEKYYPNPYIEEERRQANLKLESSLSLTKIYDNMYDTTNESTKINTSGEPVEILNMYTKEPQLDLSDPKSLIINGLRRMLNFELRSSKDSSEILVLLKTILETKKLVHEFTSPEISEYSQTESSELLNIVSTTNKNKLSSTKNSTEYTKDTKQSSEESQQPSSQEYQELGHRRPEKEYNSDFDTDLSQFEDKKILSESNYHAKEEDAINEITSVNASDYSEVRNEEIRNEEIRNNSIHELIKASEELSKGLTESTISNYSSANKVAVYESPRSKSFDSDSVTADSVAEQIDSLISAALDISKLSSLSNASKSQLILEDEVLYKPDFHSVSHTDESKYSKSSDSLPDSPTTVDTTTETSVIKGRVSKLRVDIESKLKEEKELKTEKDQQKKERKRKMREQESQLKDRLAQIEDTIASMLNGNFVEEDAFFQDDNIIRENSKFESQSPISEPSIQETKLDVFEVEKNIEDIVENVFLSASREISLNSSIGTSKSNTPQKSAELESASRILDDEQLMEVVCDGIYCSILEEAFTDMLYTSYQVKEMFPIFDLPSIYNIVDILFQDLPLDINRTNIPRISDRFKIAGPEVHLIMDIINEAYASVWTNFKSEYLTKVRMVKEIKKKIESWVNYKCDEFFDEVLMDEVKTEEKTWEQFTVEKEEIITGFANNIFDQALQEILKT
eukprot:NODE_492_length_7766_cov_0.167210.p1 type:complete len:958 gc:universal NODE_492_length_7766_cov_0.167210:1569-4442(+)